MVFNFSKVRSGELAQYGNKMIARDDDLDANLQRNIPCNLKTCVSRNHEDNVGE